MTTFGTGSRRRGGSTPVVADSSDEGKENEMTTATQDAPAFVKDGDIEVGLNTRVQGSFSIPLGLKIAVDQYVKSNKGFDPGSVVREALATRVGYDGPLGGKGRTKAAGMSDEEKKAAANERAKTQRELIKLMIKQHGGEAE